MVRNKWFNNLGKTFTVTLSFILSLIHLLFQIYYRPYTNLKEGACLSFCSQWRGGLYTACPHSPQTGSNLFTGKHELPTSGRLASHWNAFFFTSEPSLPLTSQLSCMAVELMTLGCLMCTTCPESLEVTTCRSNCCSVGRTPDPPATKVNQREIQCDVHF